MVYTRGNAADFDRWAFQEGCTGWSYLECLPYFKKSQTHESGANDYRGDSGPLWTERGKSTNVLHDVLIEAGQQAGYRLNEDFNGQEQEGVGRYDCTIKDGVRCSTASAYLRVAMNQSDQLTVSTDTLVHRVIFNKLRAVGIQYHDKQQQIRTAYADKEVILCGGAINSPQLLMLSGIGPADHLRQHSIPVVVDLQGVGQNLHDHLQADLQYYCKKPVTLNRNWLPQRGIPAIYKWYTQGTGALSLSNIESGGFLRSSSDITYPDVQLHFVPVLLFKHGLQMSFFHGYVVTTTPVRPTSRGTIELKSSNPNEYPLIDPNYLSTQQDVQDLRRAVTMTREIMHQRAFNDYMSKEIYPGAKRQTDDDIDAYNREESETIYHPVGTCKMGSSSDKMAVVDTNCRVRGVDGLRVVDASVMPSVVSGNTNAPVVMIAEKVADMILGKTLLPKTDLDGYQSKIKTAK
jgi:choline dehydrogenase